jgi:WhiB family transcriptional regulator, redox-sensing transcriptional regulator
MTAVLRPNYPINPDQDGHWREQAACRRADPELFFPVSASGPSLDQVARAKAVCAGCRVKRQCLSFALRTRQEHGVWAGMSEQELRERARAVRLNTREARSVPAEDLPTADGELRLVR